MTRHFLPLIFSLLLVTALFAEETNLEKLVKQGSESLFNFELSKAEKTFEQAIGSYPNEPLGYYYYAQIFLWNYLGNSTQSDLDRFIELSGTAIDKAKAQLGDKHKEQMASLLIGNAYTQRVIAFGKAQKYLDMVWASQKANSYLKDVLELNSKNYDAYLGLGLFKFALSQVPSSFRWALNLIGFNGNLKEGIYYLQCAAQNSVLTRVESQFYYAQILSDYLMDYSGSIRLLSELQKKYPGNMLFAYSLAVVYMKDHNLASAAQILTRVTQNKSVQMKQLRAFSEFLLGEIYFKQNNFSGARAFYNRFLMTATDKSYTGLAALRLAICYESLGESANASKYYERAKGGNASVDDDDYAKKRAQWYQKNGVTAEDLKLIRYANLIEQGKYELAEDSLAAFRSSTWKKPLIPECTYYLSEALLKLKKYKAALDAASTAVKHPDSGQKWIAPFAGLTAARAGFLMGDYKTGKYYLGEAESESDFEYPGKFKMLLTAIKYSFNLL